MKFSKNLAQLKKKSRNFKILKFLAQYFEFQNILY